MSSVDQGFGYFCGIDFKIVTGIMTDNFIPDISWTARVWTHFYELHTISEIFLLMTFTHINMT